MRKTIGCALLCLMALGAFPGCGDDNDDTPPPNAALEGTWKRSDITDFSLNLASNNTYTGEFTADGQEDVSGNYTTSGNTISITDTGGSFACSENSGFTTGTYTFAISGSNLTFSNPSDSCTGRVAILTSGAWVKQ